MLVLNLCLLTVLWDVDLNETVGFAARLSCTSSPSGSARRVGAGVRSRSSRTRPEGRRTCSRCLRSRTRDRRGSDARRRAHRAGGRGGSLLYLFTVFPGAALHFLDLEESIKSARGPKAIHTSENDLVAEEQGVALKEVVE